MEDTFQRIYEKYHHDLFQFLFYMVKNREQAEDLVQEVYIRVLKLMISLKDGVVKRLGFFL
jgi:RNA polymerase sigma-70 factor (ECF subfamily)